MTEFNFISRLQNRFASHQQVSQHAPEVGIGDDAAVLSVPAGQHLLVTTDTLVSGVHFLPNDRPFDIAAKALAVSLSDLAAMGSNPAWFFLAITLPQLDPDWWDEFGQGLLEMATDASIQLAGGDTTRGPLSINITAMGLVAQGRALRRDGAKPGDLVVISGQTGLAALALQQRMAGASANQDALKALLRPQPRLALGQALSNSACVNACIDVSDGLAADLGHILKASSCGAELWLDQLPQHSAFAELTDEQRWTLQLSGGDDYELCFTLPGQFEQELPRLQEKAGVSLHVIGRMTHSSGLKLMTPNGQHFNLQDAGYEHFSERSDGQGL